MAMLALWSGVPTARAAPVTVEWSATTTFVPQLWAPGAAVETLAGTWTDRGVFDPRLRFGLAGRLVVPLGERDQISAAWGLWRDQALCDVCDEGAGPGWLGSELFGSTDLTVRYAHLEALAGDASVSLIADAVLPASRDALICNTMIAAPGAGASFDLPVRESHVVLGLSGRRPIYTHQAAPVGICSPPLDDAEVAALTGRVTATPYDGSWSGVANPRLTGAMTVGWSAIHRVFAGAPARLRTDLSSGLQIERRISDPEVVVQTLTGPLTLDAASRPVRVAVPWLAMIGWSLTDRTEIELSAGNRLPALLADPGGTFRAIPATTSFSVAIRGHL